MFVIVDNSIHVYIFTLDFSWLSKDKEEQEELRQAKMLEEEKAQFAVCMVLWYLSLWKHFQ